MSLDSELDTLADVGAEHRATRIVDEPPFSVREGGFIRKGFNAEVDRLHDILSGGKGLLAAHRDAREGKDRHPHAEDRLQQGLRLLYRGLEFVQGPQVPDTYIRKQTLVNGERYITAGAQGP